MATDTELATQLATKVSASDNNLNFTGTNPKFSNALTVQNKVLLGNNSGFGIMCLPDRNNLSEYSYLFDTTQTLLNKKATGSGECSIRIGNNNKIAVVDLAGGHANCAVYITPTSVNGSGLTVMPSYVLSNETFQMQAGKDIVVPAGSKITLDGTDCGQRPRLRLLPRTQPTSRRSPRSKPSGDTTFVYCWGRATT